MSYAVFCLIFVMSRVCRVCLVQVCLGSVLVLLLRVSSVIIHNFRAAHGEPVGCPVQGPEIYYFRSEYGEPVRCLVQRPEIYYFRSEYGEPVGCPVQGPEIYYFRS